MPVEIDVFFLSLFMYLNQIIPICLCERCSRAESRYTNSNLGAQTVQFAQGAWENWVVYS